jgi:ferredoxin-NADP reductase
MLALSVMAASDTMRLRVARIAEEAVGINSYELVDPAGGELPPFTAGAHIDVYLPGPIVRQYSLCNDPAERHRYVIAVLRERAAEGASQRLHDAVHAGEELFVSQPRNRFPLVEGEGGERYLLLAGGIGVTPLLSMVWRLAALGADFTLHYCTQSPRHTAFRGRLARLAAAGRVVHHYDGGDPARGIDIRALLGPYRPGTQLYFCGPIGFMHAVGEAAAHWPAAAVHCEYFMPEPGERADEAGLDRFEIAVAGTGQIYPVGPGETILDALRKAGAEIEPPCTSGTCGICRRPYVNGDPVHRDRLLTESEKREFVLLCRARSRSPLLVIDL